MIGWMKKKGGGAAKVMLMYLTFTQVTRAFTPCK